jgi:hypothetical protein
MRYAILVLFALSWGALADTARADPYPWCGVYAAGNDDNGTNCYFMTLGQCRAAVSGVGGFCTANPFYDGRPVTTPEDRISRRAKRAH